jgi:NAD(P)H-hydrate epimerase
MLPRSEVLAELARLLQRAGSAHHQAFAATDGADPNWPDWYGAYLVKPLSMLLGVELTSERLAKELAEVDDEHRRLAPAVAWPTYYAGWLVARHLPA